ncbi:hypothetical protein TNCV_420291 [Trichonephila clavipes]|uniref:Uncharacterized protein n=1 Tax=Trichonephila clavipes TaxID=2585209 RepID=A0A8X6VG43_TRICX|nr:hypothetical protein TNCV_420291 [Trichonephila clavipes]
MVSDAEDCRFQMLNDDEIATSMQEESNEIDEDEDNNNESSKGPSNAAAFSALDSHGMNNNQCCCPTQLLLLKRISDLAAKKQRCTMCPASYTAWIEFQFRLSEQSRIRMVSGPNQLG